MSQDLKTELLERSLLVDEMIERCRDNIASLSEKIGLERKMLGRHNSEKIRLKKHVSNLNEIQRMLGTSPASMAPSPSSDVPPPSSVGGGEPIAIEVNHAASIAKISDVEASVPSVLPSTEAIAEVSEESLNANTGGKNVDLPNGENHTSREKRKKQASQNNGLGRSVKRSAARKIVASLTENADQTLVELAEKFSVSKPYVSMVCAKHNLNFKKLVSGRPPKVRSACNKSNQAKSNLPVGQPKTIASTSLTTRPSSLGQQKTKPFFEPSKRKVKILYRIVVRETGMFLHQDLMGMKKGTVFVESKQFAWQGDETQLKGCAALLGFNLERLKKNDATYGFFAQKFEV